MSQLRRASRLLARKADLKREVDLVRLAATSIVRTASIAKAASGPVNFSNL
jgi:hypothetical protein